MKSVNDHAAIPASTVKKRSASPCTLMTRSTGYAKNATEEEPGSPNLNAEFARDAAITAASVIDILLSVTSAGVVLRENSFLKRRSLSRRRILRGFYFFSRKYFLRSRRA